MSTARARTGLVGSTRTRRATPSRELVRFMIAGGACTALYALLFLAQADLVGAQVANATSLLATALANTEVNRRWSFPAAERGGAGPREHLQGLLVFAVSVALTSGALWTLPAVVDPTHVVELTVLVIVSLLSTALRFLALRMWVFR